MNEKQLQQAFIQFLAKKLGAKDQKDLERKVQQLGEEGLKAAYAEFQQAMQGQTKVAKLGAKLDYVKSLRGQCPSGYEVTYFSQGGNLVKGCKKCQQGSTIEEDVIEQFKCGKKIKKHQLGGTPKRKPLQSLPDTPSKPAKQDKKF